MPVQHHTAIYWEFALSLICAQTAINTVWKEGDKYTGVVHAANILEGVTDTAHSTVLWPE